MSGACAFGFGESIAGFSLSLLLAVPASAWVGGCRTYQMTQHSFREWVIRAVITDVIAKLVLPSNRGTGPSR